MYEPKYKLNKKDAARWHELLVRHCLDCPAKPGHKRRFIRKYPPLTPEENAEFERLCRKRSKKVESHPKVKASIRRSQRQTRKVERLLKQLEALMAKLKIKVDR
jgi:hypothetical protein